MKLSLTARLLLAGTLVLTAFLGVTGLILDHAFRDYAEQSLQQRLQAVTVGLVAAAVPDIPSEPAEAPVATVSTRLPADMAQEAAAEASEPARTTAAVAAAITLPAQQGRGPATMPDKSPGMPCFFHLPAVPAAAPEILPTM